MTVNLQKIQWYNIKLKKNIVVSNCWARMNMLCSISCYKATVLFTVTGFQSGDVFHADIF